MADFYAPPAIQVPDMLRLYMQGRMAPGVLQQAQDDTQASGLKLDQLRTLVQNDQALSAYARGVLGGSNPTPSVGGMTAPQSNVGGTSGGIQNGPQASVSSAVPQGQGSGWAAPQSSAVAPYATTEGAIAILQGKDPNEAATKSFEFKQRNAQLHAQPALTMMESVATADSAAQIIKNNPTLLQGWIRNAPQLGLDPYRDLTDENARKVATWGYNQIASGVGLPAKPMPNPLQSVTGAGGYQYLEDPLTHKPTEIPGQITPYQNAELGIQKQRLDLDRSKAGSADFTPEEGALMAALAERGVSLPTGMRGQAQQKALYSGLLSRNAGQSPDQIADLVKSGKIDITAQLKEVSTAAGVAGKVAVAGEELNTMAPIALAASAKVPRDQFVPFNKLKQMGERNISDPNLRQLYVATNSILNAYDLLAARGGTDVAKREAAHTLLSSADSPEAYAAAVNMFQVEAKAAKDAARMAEGRKPEAGGGSSGVLQEKTLGGKTYVQTADGKWREK